MNKTALAIVSAGLLIAIALLFSNGSRQGSEVDLTQPGENVTVTDGIQYVTVNARGGYSPRVSVAQAGLPTKLVVKTNGTYDCSLALVIRSLGYQKILAQTGEEVIDLGTVEAGSSLQGTCSMGMYSFSIKFI